MSDAQSSLNHDVTIIGGGYSGTILAVNPLLRNLLDGGAASLDPLDIGIAVDERSRVVGADKLWAMSTLTKGRYWEITAVPDIRAQAAGIAAQIAEEFAQ